MKSRFMRRAGTILDRNGEPLAISVPVASVSVNPQQIQNLRVATEVLGNTLNLDQNVLYSRLEWARDNHKGLPVGEAAY